MLTEIITYALAGFGAALIVSLLIKFLFSKNVETVNMSKDLKSNFYKGKSMQEQVRNLAESESKNEASELLNKSGNLSSDQSESVIDMLEKFSGEKDAWGDSNNELFLNVKKLIKENKKIEAAKLIMNSGKMSLKDAKDIIDKVGSGNFDI